MKEDTDKTIFKIFTGAINPRADIQSEIHSYYLISQIIKNGH